MQGWKIRGGGTFGSLESDEFLRIQSLSLSLNPSFYMTYDTEAVVLWTQEGSFTTLLINAVLFQ